MLNRRRNMKYLAIALALVLATPALADTKVYGRVTHVEPIYSRTYVEVPQSVCYDVQVPVTGRANASTGDVLAGALIGGAIGNQFGGGSGQDAATVLGAILGADAANKNGRQVVTGYRVERQCDTQYVTDVQQTISGWTVYYKWKGGSGSFDTDRDNYVVGDRVLLKVSAY
jgi:uncharacterized protein YcfJ